jgi:predicted Ser/Thr protein kinase
MQVPDGIAGKQVRCPTCKQAFTVGAAPAPAPAPAARQPAVVGVQAAVPPKPAAPAPSPAAPPPPNRLPPVAPVPPSAPVSVGGPSECPACKSTLLPGAIACMDCGYLIQPEGVSPETEGPPNLCTNPACGVANPAGEKNCQRCGTPLAATAGTMLHGRYRLEKLLAMGGFGAVYLATDTKGNNRQVAIKDMISADPQEFAIRLNFFRREAEILRSLEAVPIVPRVYDFIQQGQSAHLVIEFIPGQDLLKLMEANGNKPFPIAQVIEWARNICDVLAHMHGQSPPLIHRDLKPDNIMLLTDQRSIKMIDFGTARDLGKGQRTRLAAKTRVYTEGYAPSEQIIGKPEPRSDLFALAATLYHLATGQPPEGFYTAKTIDAELAKPNCSYPPQYRWFFELIKTNLAEDANDRYFSAREINADLEKQRVTKEVTCPKCQATNPVRSPYCVKCAEALTDPTAACNHCGKNNRMGSRCCIHCGNRLR